MEVDRKGFHFDYVPEVRFNNMPAPENAYIKYNSSVST